jgi:hypothetical protein
LRIPASGLSGSVAFTNLTALLNSMLSSVPRET